MVEFVLKSGQNAVHDQGIAKEQLGVGSLPEQKVADAGFAAGADHQIRIRHMRQSHGSVQILGRQLHALCHQLLRGLGNIPATAVVEAHIENQARIVRGGALRLLQACAHLVAQTLTVTHEVQTHAVTTELRNFLGQSRCQQAHESRNLFLRTIPVLGRKRKYRENLHAALYASASTAAQGLHALLVTRKAREQSALGPPPIAFHDDGDMARNRAVF